MIEDINKQIRLAALKNAIEHQKVPITNAVLGLLIKKHPEIKSNIREVIQRINAVIQEVSQGSYEEWKEELLAMDPDALSPVQEEEVVRELPGITDPNQKVRVRVEPSPTGFLHYGHMFVLIYNKEYVRRYGGEMILRIADTNPDQEYASFYDAVLEDADWLTEGYNEVYYQSDRLEIYYEHVKKLIAMGKAYVCLTPPEEFQELKAASKASPYRADEPTVQLERFDKMFTEYAPGSAVVRFKADLEHKNPALRDFALMRISGSSHPKQPHQRVWPLMDLSVALDDHLMGLTHVIRGKDLEISTEKQKMILECFKMAPPTYIHIGRHKFSDIALSKREHKKLIEEGVYSGWDDVRLPLIRNLKRRGFTPQGIRDMVMDKGVSKRDSVVSEQEFMKRLHASNKNHIELFAQRRFFVAQPKEMHITNITEIPFSEVLVPKHPDIKHLGERLFNLLGRIYLEQGDVEKCPIGSYIRLMHCGNFKRTGEDTLEYISRDVDKSLKASLVHFLIASESNESCTIGYPDGSTVEGIVEPLDDLQEGQHVQFERVGFCVLHKYDRLGHHCMFTQR